MKAWKRYLKVIFTSSTKGKKLILNDDNSDEFALDISINKYLSAIKDTCTINVYNLPYDIIIKLIANKYDIVEVYAGYQNANKFCVFKGGITYISHSLEDASTTKCIIICSSLLIAKYNSFRLNLTLNSGINLYGAVNYICKAANIKNSRIDENLKNEILTENISVDNTAGNFLEVFASQRDDLCVNSDSTEGNVISVFKIGQNQRRINLTNKNTTLASYPRLTSDGMTVSMLCTYNFKSGDIIKVDSTLIDVSASTYSEAKLNPAYYLDTSGCYIVMTQSISLQNRGNSFTNTITAKSYNLYKSILRGDTE